LFWSDAIPIKGMVPMLSSIIEDFLILATE